MAESARRLTLARLGPFHVTAAAAEAEVAELEVAEAAGLRPFAPFVRKGARATSLAPSHRLILATYKGKPAGGCEVSVDNSMAMLRHLSVLEPYRHRGVARSLLAEACGLLEDLKAVRLVTRLFAGTGEEHTLERYGFVRGHLSEDHVSQMPPFLWD